MANVDHDVPVPPYTSHVEEGSPEDVIWSVARREHTDVVLVGCNHRTLIERLSRGNTSEQLLAELPCSLLSVPL